MPCIPSQWKCSPPSSPSKGDLAALVRSYRTHNRPDSEKELSFFQEMPSIDLAVHYAALAIDERNKRYSHQCRISQPPLKRAKQLLLQVAQRIESCATFHELHTLLNEVLGKIRGLGELYIYDTTLRLGAFCRLAPEFVYLHRGTRTGARALGLNTANGCLTISELPISLQVLPPHEIEDFLCIYKGHFAN